MDDIRGLLKKIEVKREEVLRLRQASQALPKAEEQLEDLIRELIKYLDSRDLVQRGNMGWEGRVTMFLLELIK